MFETATSAAALTSSAACSLVWSSVVVAFDLVVAPSPRHHFLLSYFLDP